VKVAETIPQCRAALAADRRGGRRIGFVPTMGSLHEGHLSLVDRARQESDLVVLSIIVNPPQFGPNDDFERYPRDLERDLALAESRGVDVVFAPPLEEMIPEPSLTTVTMRVVTEAYEGTARPGHFEGVLTIVTKLFHIVQPDVAVFGQKDAQQVAAIRRMIADLDFAVRLVVAPTVRDADGLAASSRNIYLSPDERREALALSRAVGRAAELARQGEGDATRLEAAMREELARSPSLAVEYAAVVDAGRFTAVVEVAGPCVAAVAARVGATRLIDNVPLGPDG
jgi:pantoate--beta-alanine ligase